MERSRSSAPYRGEGPVFPTARTIIGAGGDSDSSTESARLIDSRWTNNSQLEYSTQRRTYTEKERKKKEEAVFAGVVWRRGPSRRQKAPTEEAH